MYKTLALLISLSTFISSAYAVEGEQYISDQIGVERVEAYLTTPVGKSILDETAWKRAAIVRTKVIGKEVINSKEYIKVQSKYDNFPGINENIVYRRSDAQGAYAASKTGSTLKEWMYLKFPATVGQKWMNGTHTMQIVEKLSMKTPLGDFDNCLKITEAWPVIDTKNVISGEQFHCPGVGQVRAVVTQKIQMTHEQQTITRLVAHKKP